MGRELDNYHGPYRYFTAEAGDLDYYFIGGPEPADVVRRYTWLTGRPLFSPEMESWLFRFDDELYGRAGCTVPNE